MGNVKATGKKYTGLRKEAEKTICDEKVGKIKEQFSVLLKRKTKLEDDLKGVNTELAKLEEEGLIKAVEVSGGGISSYTWTGIDMSTTTGSTGLHVQMGA